MLQSRPNEIEFAWSASPVVVSRKGSGSASDHRLYSLCKATSSATAYQR
jgi:hypothetical protein